MIQKRFLALAAAMMVIGMPLSPATALTAVAQNFAFTPPSQSPVFPDMVIAILRAKPHGTLFAQGATRLQRRAAADEMVAAIGTDLENIIIAKGFRSAGKNLTRASMSEKQKSAATMILDPELTIDLKVLPKTGAAKDSSVRITAHLTLAFTEPSTGESLWLKQITITPITRIFPEAASEDAAFTDALQGFYQSMMRDVWNQLNPTDFRVLAIKMVQD